MSDLSSLSDADLMALYQRQSLPRSTRNNNPGNIEDGAFARSQPGYAGTDGRFAVFDSPEAGSGAHASLLRSYSGQGRNTVRSIVSRWAPSSENDTEGYVRFVSDRMGVAPDARLDLNDESTLSRLQSAMAAQEGGDTGPADLGGMSDAELEAAYKQARMAGDAGDSASGRTVTPPTRAAYPAPNFGGSPRVAPKPPSTGLLPREALGLAKGVAEPISRTWGRLESGPILKRLADQTASTFPVFNFAREGERGLVEGLAIPAIRKAESAGVKPGKIGEFVGNMAVTIPSTLGASPLAAGAVTGAQLSEAKGLKGVAKDAAIGAVTARATAALSDAAQLGLRKLLSKAPKIADLPALTKAKRALYQQVDRSGFVFAPEDVQKLAADFADGVREMGGPKAAQIVPGADAFAARLDALSKQPGGVKLGQLDKLRSDIFDALISKGGAEAQQGYTLRRMIDGLMDANDAPFIRDARLANTMFEKVSDVSRRLKSAKLAAGRANSGENLVNAMRQKLSPMVDPLNSAQVTNLTPDETTLLERIVEGDRVSNGLRNTSKLLRNKFVSGPLAIMTGAGAGPWSGLALMGGLETAGQGLRAGAENYTKAQIDQLLRLMGAGGSRSALARIPTTASNLAERAVAAARPGLVAASVPALAAARKKPAPSKASASQR